MKKTLPVLFILLHLVVGGLIVSDYGVPVDEYGNVRKGRVTLHYVKAKFGVFDEAATRHAMGEWEKLQSKYYGTFFEMTMTELTDLLHIEDHGDAFRVRHGIVFLLFWLSGLAMYGMLRTAGLSSKWSLTGWSIYILHPRIFSQSFYNHKDVMFLSMCVVCLFFMTKWLLKNCRMSAVLFVVSTAVASATRVMGVELLALGLGWWGWRCLMAGGMKLVGRRLWVPIVVCLGFALVLFCCWPYLWEGPVKSFQTGFSVMANYEIFGGTNLFKGERVPSADLPLDYIPHWIGITTPIFTLLAFLVGVLLFGRVLMQKRWESLRNDQVQLGLVGVLMFIGAYAAVVVKGSALYDGWRQVYFIWPGLVMVAVVGLSKLPEKLALPLMVLLALEPVSYLVRAHPHGMVYFNAFAGETPGKNYEGDYWGLGYRQGLVELAKIQPEGDLLIYDTFWRSLYFRGNVTLLPDEDRDRFVSVRNIEEAEYLITNYRPGEHVKNLKSGLSPLDKPLWELVVDDVPVVGVYELR